MLLDSQVTFRRKNTLDFAGGRGGGSWRRFFKHFLEYTYFSRLVKVIIRILQPFLCFFLLLGFIYLFISLTSWIFIPYSFSRYSVTRYGLTLFSNTLWKKRVPEQPFSSLRRWPGGKFLKLVILSHQANSYTSTNSSCTILLWIEMLWFIIRPIFDSCKVRLWIDKCRSSSWRRHHITGSRGDVFVVRTSKPVENFWKNGLFWSRYSFVTFYRPQTNRVRARKMGLQCKIHFRASVALRSSFGRCAVLQRGYGLRLLIFKITKSYSRFIKIPLG